ncbi:MAG TPA: response regulator transcription factor [Actinomycetota bacterium]|nr:response regulator transcription factor [Actinomycetota bacterium]
MPQFNRSPADAGWTIDLNRLDLPTSSLKVLLVNQHLMLLEGLMAAVQDEPDIEVVGAATSVARALSFTQDVDPDVIVLGLESDTAVDAAAGLRSRFRGAAVVVIATTVDDALQLKALDAGCSAVVTKGGTIAELVVAIRAAARGDAMFPGSVLRQFLRRSRERAAQPELTERELEILRLLANGESTESITERLTLSPHTVRNHVKNLMGKLSAHSRLEAVMKGHALGLIEQSPKEAGAGGTARYWRGF